MELVRKQKRLIEKEEKQTDKESVMDILFCFAVILLSFIVHGHVLKTMQWYYFTELAVSKEGQQVVII